MNKYGIIDGEDLVVIGYTFNEEKFDDLCKEMAFFRHEKDISFSTFDLNKVVDYLVNCCNVISIDSIKMTGKKGYAGIYDIKYYQLPQPFYKIKEIRKNPFSLDSLKKVLTVLYGRYHSDKEIFNEYVTVFKRFFECFEQKEISKKKVDLFRQSFNEYVYTYDFEVSDDSCTEINEQINKYIEDAKLRSKYVNIINNGFRESDIFNFYEQEKGKVRNLI